MSAQALNGRAVQPHQPRRFIEPFAGSGAVSLQLVGGRQLQPLVSWMGGKRRMAPILLRMMGLRPGLGARELVLNDAGPWGRVWPLLSTPGGAEAVAEILDAWHASGVPIQERWEMLKEEGPREDPTGWVAQWLLLQSRSASGVPLFWAEEDLRQGSGGGRSPQPAGQRGRWLGASNGQGTIVEAGQKGRNSALWRGHSDGEMRAATQKTTNRAGWGGLVRIATLAERVTAVGDALAGIATTCFALRAEEVLPAGSLPPGTFVYLDPPYRGCTGYGWDCLRADLLHLADRWAAAGAVVVISEAEGLRGELGPAWSQEELTEWGGGKPEWVTCYPKPVWRPERQLRLGLGVAA